MKQSFCRLIAVCYCKMSFYVIITHGTKRLLKPAFTTLSSKTNNNLFFGVVLSNMLYKMFEISWFVHGVLWIYQQYVCVCSHKADRETLFSSTIIHWATSAASRPEGVVGSNPRVFLCSSSVNPAGLSFDNNFRKRILLSIRETKRSSVSATLTYLLFRIILLNK